jgi:hypothetical protein
MSSDSIPATNGQHKPLPLIDETLTIREVFGVLRIDGPPLPSPPPAPTRPTKRRPPRKSGLYLVLEAAQQHGITHPTLGGFLQLPREFDAILALEHKAIAQVVLEVLRQTIGTVVYGQDGRSTHRTGRP